ncbi:hypothetical protein P3T35_005086 [Kitasatospora sp. GP30]|nr:hypothetical protein [Kitasatospora sp. GP30]
MHRGTEGAGRIGPRSRRRSAPGHGRAFRVVGLLGAALCAMLVVHLISAGPSPDSGAFFALLTLGGWGLGVLPVHSDSGARGPARRSAAQPQPSRSGVEAGLLQDGTER